MRKTAVFCAAMLFIPVMAYAEVTLDNEITFGNAKYFSYSIDAGIPADDINYSLDGSFSRGSDHDSSFLAGVSLGYKINDTFNLHAGYKYDNDTSYPAYEIPVLTYLLTYKQILSTNTIDSSIKAKFGDAELTPSLALALDNLRGVFSAKRQSNGIVSVEKDIANKSFGQLSPGLDASYDITDSLTLSAGGNRNFYNINVQQVLDASGATNTVSKEAAALKTAVQLQVYNLNAGVVLFLGDFMANFSYVYSSNYHPSSGLENDFTNDFTLFLNYVFNDDFNMGIRLESAQAHYTDNTFSGSRYLGVQANFTIE